MARGCGDRGVAAGIFGLAGQQIVRGLFGASYGAKVGTELGRLVVFFAPWAVAAVGVSVAFPLMFVARRTRRLPLIAVATVLVHVPLAFLGQIVGGLDGLALALAATTTLVLLVLLHQLGAAGAVVRGLGMAALTVAVATVIAFLPLRFVLAPVIAAVVGVVVYGALLLLVRPPGLTAAWKYLRALA